MRRALLWGAMALALAGTPAWARQAPAGPAATVAERTRGLTRMDGFVPLYWDAARGRVLLEVPAFDQDVLYYVSAAQGAGSVELPFDRGIMSSEVVHFVRSGPRVLVVAQHTRYRAVNGTPAQQQNVKDSFASSVLASLPVEADENGKVLVDGTPLFMRDAADVESRLRRVNQGAFRFDAGRSGFVAPRLKAFPRNSEIETISTFGADNPGQLVTNVTPDGRSFTLRIHHSFLQAPEGYTPRVADPRIGVSAVTFRDYAKPVNEGTETQWVTRWRLEKKDPTAAVSEPKQPIVFYLDLGIPEPVRSAMRQGVLWWNVAFEAAGYRNAIEVRDPTPEMDPMDIRYAWILWIDRDERGFSSGGTYRDPRTGEILGSKTRMDSHRIRTIGNYLDSYNVGTTGGGDDHGMFAPNVEVLEALAAQQRQAGGGPTGTAVTGVPTLQRDLVLLRQSLLSAHELGHALGFPHNWAASLDNFGSVMEYPTPRVKVVNGKLDLSEAFQSKIGAWDVMTARYAYTDFPKEKEQAGLEAIVKEYRAKGLHYVPETDPRWCWYDDRATPIEYLRETTAARKIMLEQYGPAILRPGEPLGALRDLRLWMTYLHHRWAIQSGQQYIGGMFHEYAVKGDTLTPTEIVPAATQREILGLLMEGLDPASLALPEALLAQLPPHPGDNLEDMSGDYAFDHLQAARILAGMIVGDLLEPARAARLVAFADRQQNALTLPEVLQAVLKATWSAPRDAQGTHRSIRRATQRTALDAMMMLGGDAKATPEVRAVVLQEIAKLGQSLAARHDDDAVTEAHYRQAERDIAFYMENPKENAPKAVSPGWGSRPRSRFPLPPGPPLGGGGN